MPVNAMTQLRRTRRGHALVAVLLLGSSPTRPAGFAGGNPEVDPAAPSPDPDAASEEEGVTVPAGGYPSSGYARVHGVERVARSLLPAGSAEVVDPSVASAVRRTPARVRSRLRTSRRAEGTPRLERVALDVANRVVGELTEDERAGDPSARRPCR
jgi:hypothetical protein